MTATGTLIDTYTGCPVENYRRWRTLSRLFRGEECVEPTFKNVSAEDLARTHEYLARLDKLVDRCERRQLSNHWAYDVSEHVAAAQAHEAETWIAVQQETALREAA